MPDISTDIHLKEFSNVRFYPRQRYGPRLHRRESALRDLGKAVFLASGHGQSILVEPGVPDSPGDSEPTLDRIRTDRASSSKIRGSADTSHVKIPG
jgi:hypothetical protein